MRLRSREEPGPDVVYRSVPGAVCGSEPGGIRPNLLSHRTTLTGRDRCRLHTPARGTRAGSPQLSDAAGRKSRIPLHHHQARVPSPPASSVPLPSTCWVWVRATHAGAHTAVRPPLTRAAGAGLNSPGSISLNDSRHTRYVAGQAGRPSAGVVSLSTSVVLWVRSYG